MRGLRITSREQVEDKQPACSWWTLDLHEPRDVFFQRQRSQATRIRESREGRSIPRLTQTETFR